MVAARDSKSRFARSGGSSPLPGTKYMKPKISLITLGVSNLERSIKFYREGLKLPMQERKDDSDIAFFTLQGTWLSLYPKNKLAEDAEILGQQNPGFREFTLAHNVGTEEEVDELLKFAEKAGGKIVKQPKKAEWGGYSGYFADPDNFLWEVAYNPFIDLT